MYLGVYASQMIGIVYLSKTVFRFCRRNEANHFTVKWQRQTKTQNDVIFRKLRLGSNTLDAQLRDEGDIVSLSIIAQKCAQLLSGLHVNGRQWWGRRQNLNGSFVESARVRHDHIAPTQWHRDLMQTNDRLHYMQHELSQIGRLIIILPLAISVYLPDSSSYPVSTTYYHDVRPMLAVDDGPALAQHRVNVSCSQLFTTYLFTYLLQLKTITVLVVGRF